MILDLKNCPEHHGCRVFHVETGEEIHCDYADDVAGLVRGHEYHLEDGQPIFHPNEDGVGVRRHEWRVPVRIDCPPGVVLEPVPPVAFECPWAERFRRADAAVGRGEFAHAAPMAHPDFPGYLAREARIATVPRPGSGPGEPPEAARLVVRFAAPARPARRGGPEGEPDSDQRHTVGTAMGGLIRKVIGTLVGWK